MNPFSEEISEIAIAELADVGCDSFENTENGINAYISEQLYDERIIADTIKKLLSLTKIEYKTTYVKAQDWNAVWESNFEPIVIDGKCTVRAPFHVGLPKTEYEIVVMPKMSFGTGHHATTYLVAEALLDMNLRNLQVLDMGCGTGILAIIAAKKNAAHIDAIDIDEWACDNAVENVKNNGVAEKITVKLGNASLLGTEMYDLILANINRNILVEDMKYYAKALKKGGTIVVSGIFSEDVAIVELEAKKYNLIKKESKNRDKWARAQFEK